MKTFRFASLLLMIVLAVGSACAQTASAPAAAATPAPVTSTFNFGVGAAAFGLGGTSQATPASDVVLTINPGFKKLTGLEFRSDNLLAPGSNQQYYGAGGNFEPPLKFPATSVFAPLSFYVDATVGVSRIVPPTGPSLSHIGFMAGGGLRWLTASGVKMTLIEVNILHAPGAPWGNNAPAISGGIAYIWGKH